MAYQFPKNPINGETAEVQQPNGTVFIYTYNASQNTWELAGQGVDLDQNNIVIYTDNVLTRTGQTRPPIPATPIDLDVLGDQRLVNWALFDEVNYKPHVLITNAEPIERPDTQPLREGDVWYDRKVLRFWEGANWVEYIATEDFTADQARQDNNINELTKYLQSLIEGSPEGEFLPLKGGVMTGPVQYDSTPYNGLTVFGKDGVDYNNNTKMVFRAENAGQYGNPSVIVGVEPTAANHAVTKKYVDDIAVELEEEIDAIAPSVERGSWSFNLGGLASSRGQLSMYDNDYANVGNPIGIFKQAKSIWLNEEDNAGTPHGFDNVEAGNLLELFVEGEADYGLFEVVDVHDETNGAAQWWVIEVNFVRALSDTSLASNGDNIRLKIFSAPEGGTADGFVLKSGDKMSGNLIMEEEPFAPGSPSPKIEFKSNNDAGDSTYVNSLYMVKNSAFLYTSGDFGSGGALSADGNIQYQGETRIGMTSENNNNYLGVGTSGAYSSLQWNKLKGVTHIRANNGWGTNGQVLTKYSNSGTDYVYWDTPSTIKVIPNTPDDPQVGDCWFSTDKNTFIIKVA